MPIIFRSLHNKNKTNVTYKPHTCRDTSAHTSQKNMRAKSQLQTILLPSFSITKFKNVSDDMLSVDEITECVSKTIIQIKFMWL